MKHQINKHAIVLLIFSGLAYVVMSHAMDSNTLKSHVNVLCSKALGGRLTGSVGEKRATQYVADTFRDLGLEPAGDKGTYFQTFAFNDRLSLGQNNVLKLTNAKAITTQFVLGKDWRPMSFSDNRSFESAVVIFAGYGIVAPSSGASEAYNDYRHLHVANKWVLVFAGGPHNITAAQRQQVRPYLSLRYKAFIAKKRGAKGIIFVNSPSVKHSSRLVSFVGGRSSLGSGIIALSVTPKVMATLLQEQAHRSTPIKLSGQTDIKQHIAQGRNVLAKLKFSEKAAPMMIVSAHIDHLGKGELGGSRDPEKGFHPGADDNASGVASMLEMAHELTTLKAQGKLKGHADILFAAWSGEELGLLGSTYFVKIRTHKSLSIGIKCVLNLDMVGHLRDSLVIQGVGSSKEWPIIIDRVKKKHPMSVITQNDPYLPTDSTPFYLQGVPSLNFFSGADDSYHTQRDTPDKLNYPGIKRISYFILGMIQSLESHPNAIAFAAVEKKHDPAERAIKVYLGTIPDYTNAKGDGVMLSGVAKNSPAEQAGLQSHDRILALAGQRIHDIYDYTFVLNTLEPGKSVYMDVHRGQKNIKLRIVARLRDI